MNIYLLKIPEQLTFSNIEPYLSFVSDARRETILRYVPEDARIRSLLAALLVRYGIRTDLHLQNADLTFDKNEYGKPFLYGHANYHFSLSHSGKYVAFASGDAPIGIDVERRKEGRDNIAGRFFTSSEAQYAADNGLAGFYEVWTKKEAYVKFLGTGFSTSISSFDVFTDLGVSLVAKQLDGYTLSICCKKALPDSLPIMEVNFTQLCRLFPLPVN
ncbi:4'-phosphopantetheinyl transferase [Lachnospiraceae bacterium XBB1006]|nr:4'-phosphopantetheinyl transferase [Lachnospiraceae bacterium XBB1006]